MSDDAKVQLVNSASQRIAASAELNRLSNVRTYLAWIRTGLASVGGGIAVIKWLTFDHPSNQVLSKVMGGLLVILGIAIFLMSMMQYRQSHREFGIKDVLAGGLVSITMMSLVLSIISFVLLILVFL